MKYPAMDESVRHGAGPDVSRKELPWINAIKGAALLWILCNHFVEATLGSPFMANPTAEWPPFAVRIAQLLPLHGHGIWDVPLNLIRYCGWLGDQGVGLFIIISGFGLAWGLLNRRGLQPVNVYNFYSRRALRIYPLWWSTHLLFIAAAVFAGGRLSPFSIKTWLSFLGVRCTSGLFYFYSPAWWYIGLLIQLYLVFPLLWKAVVRWGAAKVFFAGCLIGCASRAIGFLFAGDFIDKWSMGAFFVTRLPEFCFGILLASLFFSNGPGVDRRIRSWKFTVAMTGIYLLANGLSLSLPGMVVAPALLGIAGFFLIYTLFFFIGPRGFASRGVQWFGRHSYAIFLVHHPFIKIFLNGRSVNAVSLMANVTAVLVFTVAVSLSLEKVTQWVTGGLLDRFRRKKIILTAGTLLACAGIVLVSLEIVVRTWAPQEVLGWGERPSLVQDSLFGWKLKPSSTTRLRWESYDYEVKSNSLGFPGPEYPVLKGPNTFRILTTGDAFTSAEGVNTDKAWPRVLEKELLKGAKKTSGNSIEVMNFAITGYGPNEYLAVVRQFVPVYKPDIVISEFFVNDFDDVLQSASLRNSIGVNLPPSDGWYSLFHLSHLEHYISYRMIEPVKARLINQQGWYGYFLGNFAACEKGRISAQGETGIMTARRFHSIKDICEKNGARLLLVLVPAPVQVCGPADLKYYPPNVNIMDSLKFDFYQPQRIMKGIAYQEKIPYIDLLPVLKNAPAGCPYQPWNMHWTEEGHDLVGKYVAREVGKIMLN